MVTVQAQTRKALFDNTKNETAGNADWIIDSDQPIPSPAQSGITQSTAENFWLGAISAWGVDLVKQGFTVHTLTSANGITYGNVGNSYDLSNYNLFIVCEPQDPFSASEKQAIKNFVSNGGGLMMVADHNGSDRNSNGWDSPQVWNDLGIDSLFGLHFQSTSETNNNFSQVATNVSTSSGDSIIHGGAGTATSLSYHSGTSINLLTAKNTTATGHIWMNSISHGSSQIMAATANYGKGKVAGVGDSSPADDGSAQSGNSNIFDGWTEAGATDNIVFLNMCLWLIASNAPSTPGQVSLVSPTDAGTNIAVPSLFTWRQTQNTTNYQFQLSTSNSFSSFVTNDSILTDTTKAVSNLSLNTTYYWRVRAKNAIGWGSYSIVRSFTTWSIPAQVQQVSPADGTVNVSIPTTFLWQRIQNAVNYHFQLSLSNTFSSLIVNDSTLTDTSRVVSGSTVNTTYYWRVRAKNGAGWGSFSTIRTYITWNIPAQVQLISPSDNITDVPVPTIFRWQQTPTTVNYQFQLSQSDTFSLFATNDSTLTDTTKSISGLAPLTTYFWRARAKNGAGWGTFSATRNFTTWNTPPHVQLVTPFDSSADVEIPTNFTWQHASTSTNYQFQLSSSDTFSSLAVDDSTMTDTIKIVSSISLNTAYYWRVRAKNGSGWGSFSNSQIFKTWNTPDQVQLWDPADAATDVPVPTLLVWHQATMSLNYQIQLSVANNFSSLVANDSTIADTSITVPNLLLNATYYWRVRGRNNAGWSPYSITRNFTTWNTPSQVILQSPADGAQGMPSPVDFRWSAINGSTNYHFELSSTANFSTLVQSDSTLTDTVLTVAGLDSLTTYYWKVRAKNNAGWGPFSSTSSFRLSIQQTFTGTVDRRWNLISIPLQPPDSRRLTLFPTSISAAYAYDGTYVQTDSLKPGHGYWLKFNSKDTINLFGELSINDTIDVKAGWNLIGTISLPVDINLIVSIPDEIIKSNFYEYRGSYLSADTLLPLKGYWVKCDQPGKLIISSQDNAPYSSKNRHLFELKQRTRK